MQYYKRQALLGAVWRRRLVPLHALTREIICCSKAPWKHKLWAPCFLFHYTGRGLSVTEVNNSWLVNELLSKVQPGVIKWENCVCVCVCGWMHTSNIYIYYLSAYGAGKRCKHAGVSGVHTLDPKRLLTVKNWTTFSSMLLMNISWIQFFFFSPPLDLPRLFLHAGVLAALTEKLPRVKAIKSVQRGSRTTQRPSWSRMPGINVMEICTIMAVCVVFFFVWVFEIRASEDVSPRTLVIYSLLPPATHVQPRRSCAEIIIKKKKQKNKHKFSCSFSMCPLVASSINLPFTNALKARENSRDGGQPGSKSPPWNKSTPPIIQNTLIKKISKNGFRKK